MMFKRIKKAYKRIKKAYRIIENFSNPDNYNKQLEDNRWKAKKLEILNKHNNKCDLCGSTKYLQIHHKYYNKYPNEMKVPAWDYLDNCFMCLCKSCHKKYHSKYKVKTYYRKY